MVKTFVSVLSADSQLSRCFVRCRDSCTNGWLSVPWFGPSRHQQCISSKVSYSCRPQIQWTTDALQMNHVSQQYTPCRTGSALALLYGTSATLEHHHFNHAVMILQSEVRPISLAIVRHKSFFKHSSRTYCVTCIWGSL